MSTALNSLLGIAANGALLTGMAVGGPWGLAAGGVVSSLITFFSDVFGDNGSTAVDTYMDVVSTDISDAVNEIKTAIQLDITNLQLSNLTAAQDEFSTYYKSTQKSTYNPSVGDLVSDMSDMKTIVEAPALNAMKYSENQINNNLDTSLSTLGIHALASTLLLNSCKLRLSLRRVEDAKNIIANNAANPSLPESLPKTQKGYPEFTQLTTYMDQILTFLKPQVDLVNKSFVDMNVNIAAIASAADVKDYVTQGQSRMSVYMKATTTIVAKATQLLPPAVYDVESLQNLNQTYLNLTHSADQYKNL